MQKINSTLTPRNLANSTPAPNTGDSSRFNRKTIAKSLAALGAIAAIGTFFYFQGKELSTMKARLQDFISDRSLLPADSTGGGGSEGGGEGIIYPSVPDAPSKSCRNGFTSYEATFHLDETSSQDTLTDISQKVTELYNEATSNGWDYFSSYSYVATASGRINCPSVDPITDYYSAHACVPGKFAADFYCPPPPLLPLAKNDFFSQPRNCERAVQLLICKETPLQKVTNLARDLYRGIMG